MAELGKKLGKLSLAILENFVEKALGTKFVGELRQPTDRELAIESALEKSEIRFTKEFKYPALAKRIFTQISDDNLGLLVDAIEKFYDQLTESDLEYALNEIIAKSFLDIDPKIVKSAAGLYISILTEEFIIADETFRDRFRGLSDIRSLEILRRVELLLSQRDSPKITAPIFRSLHQLPQPPSDFIGREKLIEDLLKDFEQHQGATITGLAGMGGIGKTALGLVLAHKIAEKYPDAQIFLDLKGTTNPLSKFDIIRHVVLSLEPEVNLNGLDDVALISTYRSVLYGKKCLIFLDNAKSADQIAYLDPPETCALLVTSRGNFAIPGLSTRHIDMLNESDAQSFLISLCERIDNKASEIAKICGYLPLALRIAGSFLKVNKDWSVDNYVAQLHNKKNRLKTLQRSRESAELFSEPDIIATFELSYRQLTTTEQMRWCALSIFPASFSLMAAAWIWETEESRVQNLLSRLCRFSLLEYDEAAKKYKFHDLLAEFAAARLPEKYRARYIFRYENFKRWQELRDRTEELTFDIGRVLHANTTTLVMVKQTLDAVVEAFERKPYNDVSLPTFEEVDAMLTDGANILASAIERFTQSANEEQRLKALSSSHWNQLLRYASFLHEFKERIPTPESYPATLRKLANDVGQIHANIVPSYISREHARELQNAAWHLERLANLIEVLETRVSVIQMEHTLHSLREFITSGTSEPTGRTLLSVKSLIEESAKRLAEYANSLKIDIESSGVEDAYVRANERELFRAFINLLHNSIKYSWHRDPERAKPAWVSVRTKVKDQKVYVEFENWGVPIKREEIEKGKVFELGYRGEMSIDRGRLGTGIGLTDALRVAKAHGGSIEIESRPVKGDPFDEQQECYYSQPFFTKVTMVLPTS